MKKYILLVLTALLVAACSTDEIDTFDSHNYLSFESSSLSYTFAFSPSTVTSNDFDIPVVYAGRFSDTDAPFEITDVPEKSTAKRGTHYELLDEKDQVIKAGTNTGIAKIRLLRTDSMAEKTYYLKLAIKENSYFKSGITDTMTVSITDRLIKPDWWVNFPYDRFLGGYTETKLRLWLEFMGVTDGSNPFDTDEYIQWLDYGTGHFIYKSYRDSAVKPKIMEFLDWLLHTKGNPVDPDTKTPVAEELGNF